MNRLQRFCRMAAAAFVLAFLVTCGGSKSGPSDTGGVPAPDVASDVVITDLPTDQFVVQDVPLPIDVTWTDVPVPTDVVETVQLLSCEQNVECESGYCVEVSPGKKFCAPTCLERPCPGGWKCTPMSGLGGDTIMVCMPEQNYLCRPCVDKDDCAPSGVVAVALCIEHGPDGRFCGQECDDSEAPCPTGFTCEAIALRDIGTFMQCVPDSGACECTEEFQIGGYKTVCYVENAAGLCEGTSQCGSSGMTACTAKTPVAPIWV